MTTARLAQPVERKVLNLVVVGSSSTVGAFEFLREAIAGTFAGGYVLLCAQAVFNSRSSPLRKQKGLQLCGGLGYSRACARTAKHRRHFAGVV